MSSVFNHFGSLLFRFLSGGTHCFVVRMTESSIDFAGGEDRNPQPTNDQAEQPQPEGTDCKPVRSATTGVTDGDERVNNGERKCDDNPSDGTSCCKGPGVPLVEPFEDLASPLAVNGDGLEEAWVCGKLYCSLLKGNQRFRHVRLFFVYDAVRLPINHASVEGSYHEGVRGQGGGPNAHEN